MKRFKEGKTKRLLAKTLAFSMLLTQMSGSIGNISVYADGLDTEESADVTVSSNGKKVSLEISGAELTAAVETAIHEGQLTDLEELRAVSGNLRTEEAWRELLSEGTLYTVPVLSEETQDALSADEVEVRFYVQKDSAKKAEKAQKELVLYGENTELSGLLAEFADTRMSSLDNAFVADDGADADYVISGDEKITVLFLNHSDEKRTFTLTVNGEKAVKNLKVASAEASMKSVLNSIKNDDFSEEIASASDLVRIEETTAEETSAESKAEETTAEASTVAEETGAAETESTTAAEETSAAADTEESTTAAEESTAAEKTVEAVETATEAAAAEEKTEAGEAAQKTLTLGSIRGLMAFDAFFRKSSDSNVSEDSDMEKSWKLARKEAIKEARENLESVAAECSTARYLQFTLAELTKFEKNSFLYSDENLTVTATVEDAAAVPADAELRVSPVTEDSNQYQAYMEALQSADNASQYSGENTKLYDIAFFAPDADGEMTELQLEKGAVTLKLSYKKEAIENGEALTVNAAEDLSVLHLPVKQEVKAAQEGVATTDLDITAEDITVEKLDVAADKVQLAEDNAGIAVASETEDSDTNATESAAAVQSVEFKTEGFSVFALVTDQESSNWTYDFLKFNDGTVYEFKNSYTDDDLAEIKKTKNDIKLEYHYVDSDEETFKQSQYYLSDRALGVAGNFHIVAFGQAALNAHTNGNILANGLVANSNFGTNSYDEVSYVKNYTKVHATSGSKSTNPLVLGNGVNVGFEDNGNAFSVNGTKMNNPRIIYKDSDTKQYVDLDAVKSEITEISNDLAQKTATGITKTPDPGNQYIEYKLNNPDGVGVLNLDVSTDLSKEIHFTGFESNHQGSIIVNVNMEDVQTVSLPKAYIYIDGQKQSTNEVTDFKAGKVIWNFINATGKSITTNEMSGTVIALGATVKMPTNLNGTVIAENTSNSGETHRSDFTGITSDDQTAFQVTKKFTDNSWPETGSYTIKIEGLGTESQSHMPAKTQLSLNKDKMADGFGDITFGHDSSLSGEKKYLYKIYEESGSESNVSYDKTVYYVKLTVNYTNTESEQTATITKKEYSTDYNTTTETGTWTNFDPRNSANTFVFTNTYETTEISVQKKWDDANNQDGLRPESITVKLLANDVEVDGTELSADNINPEDNPLTKLVKKVSVILNKDNDWKHTFENLPKYKDGKLIKYTIEEVKVKGYTGEVKTETKDGVTSFVLTNTHVPTKISVQGIKNWDDCENQDGKRPTHLMLYLYADGKKTDKEKEISADEGWTYTFTDLDKYKDGKEIQYEVKEEEVKDYQGTVTTSSNIVDDRENLIYTLTNCHTPETVDVDVTKKWDGQVQESAEFTLYVDGKATDQKLVLTKDNDWKGSFGKLPKYQEGQEGKEIVYTVVETAVSHYEVSEKRTEKDGSIVYVFTNKYIPESVPESSTPEETTTPETTTPAETTTTAETTTVAPTTSPSGNGGGGGGGGRSYHSVTPVVETQPSVLGESRSAAQETEAESTVESPVPKVLGAIRKAVQTGEDSQIAVYAIAFFGCAAALGAWLLMERRRKEEE